MSTKYVITQVHGKMFSAEFQDDVCTGLTVLNENGLAGNIYIGRVENVVKNINCAFIEIQRGIKCYYPLDANERHLFLNRKNNTAVNQGDLMLVQVSREAVKTKPATVTDKLSLTGKYVVLSSDVKGVHISGKTRKDSGCLTLKELLTEQFSFQVTEEEKLSEQQRAVGRYGFILRTNSAQAEPREVLLEAAKLVKQYTEIVQRALFGMAFTCLYTAPPTYLEAVQNIRTEQLDEIVTDDREIFNCFQQNLPPSDTGKVRLYEDALLPLGSLYALETELERALRKKVWLKCGGYLVIEQTEALSVIDVNSGKCISKKQGSKAKEETLLKVNLEAADEIARQLKLRNLSGIIIVDFINMTEPLHNEDLMSHLRKLIRQDHVPSAVVDITKLGLVELTRQRSGKSLAESWNENKSEQGQP